MNTIESSQEIVPVVNQGEKLQLVYVQMSDEEYDAYYRWYDELANNPAGAEQYYSDAGYEGDPDGAADHAEAARDQMRYYKEEVDSRR